MKTTQKKAVSSHSALEVRLNRAMEEVERYKTQLQRTKTESKVRQQKGTYISTPTRVVCMYLYSPTNTRKTYRIAAREKTFSNL